MGTVKHNAAALLLSALMAYARLLPQHASHWGPRVQPATNAATVPSAIPRIPHRPSAVHSPLGLVRRIVSVVQVPTVSWGNVRVIDRMLTYDILCGTRRNMSSLASIARDESFQSHIIERANT